MRTDRNILKIGVILAMLSYVGVMLSVFSLCAFSQEEFELKVDLKKERSIEVEQTLEMVAKTSEVSWFAGKKEENKASVNYKEVLHFKKERLKSSNTSLHSRRILLENIVKNGAIRLNSSKFEFLLKSRLI